MSSAKAARERLRSTVIEGYGGKCACCGEGTREFLELDHVNDDGAEERRKGINAYRQAVIEGFPPRYQLLCTNCNAAKARHGVCPHRSACAVAVAEPLSTKAVAESRRRWQIRVRRRERARARGREHYAEQRLAFQRYSDSLPPITTEELGRILG